MGATAGGASALARRANALVVGRWAGLPLVGAALLVDVAADPGPLTFAALGCVGVVAGANLRQRRLLTALGDRLDPAKLLPGARDGGDRVARAEAAARVRHCGRLLLALDGLLVLVAVFALAGPPNSPFLILLGWLPIEGAIAEGGTAALAAGVLAVGGMLAADGMAMRALPANATTVIRGLNLVAITAVMIALERALTRGEHAMADRAEALADAVAAERQARGELEALATIVRAGMANQGDLDAALGAMTGAVAGTLDLDGLGVFLLEPGGRLRCRAWFGAWEGSTSLTFPLGPGSVVGRVAATGAGALVRDVRLDPDYHRNDADTLSEICAPLRVGDRVLGVLNVESPRLDAYTGADLERLQRLADQMAMVLDNARLLEEQRALAKREVAVTSHELRTPLTVIRGFTSTLLREGHGLDEAEQRHFVEVIDRQAARLGRLVEDLLVVSRLQAGALQVKLGVHDPARLLADFAEEWSSEPSRVRLDLGLDLPLVCTDPDRLAQAVRNLVDNGLRYGGGEPVRVIARRAGPALVVEVRDEGPGIAPAELPHLFDRFRQAGASPAHQAGAGLGLHITGRLVDALGGSIEVSSTPGRGTSFRIRLPGEAVGGQVVHDTPA